MSYQKAWFLFLFICLISCSSKSELDGIWIGAYEITYHDGGSHKSSIGVLYDFENGNLTSKTFADIENRFVGRETKCHFEQKGDLVVLSNNKKSDTLHLLSNNNDSLVFTTYNASNNRVDIIFKNISNLKSPEKIVLVNNPYQLKSRGKIWPMDFINDSLMLDYGTERLVPWKLENYKDKTFLLFGEFDVLPLFVKSISKDTVKIVQFNNGLEEWNLTKIPTKHKLGEILGKWSWTKIETNKDSLFERRLPPPPPFPGYQDSTDTKIDLDFSKDTLTITRFGTVEIQKEDKNYNYISPTFPKYIKTRKVVWHLNSSHNFIYFPYPIPTVPYGGEFMSQETKEILWEIIDTSPENISLKARWDIRKYHYPDHGGGEPITLNFKRTDSIK